MLQLDPSLTPAALQPAIDRMWSLSAEKILAIEADFPPGSGTPVITKAGQYAAQGWTEWTQGFQFGSALLQFEATGDERFLDIGRENTRTRMAPHVTHVGVHDHGFNNVSTYGTLRRLMLAERIPHDAAELDFYELALKCSGAVQATRWTPIRATDSDREAGFVHSFNGPHSLFADTIRSMRALCLAHRLGHRLLGEHDEPICLLGRALAHARTTAEFNVYYGEGRDAYDVRGRVAHESIFNTTDGQYRCPSTQQGYSPFGTWTRGLAWIVLGYAELLEFVDTLDDGDLEPHGGRAEIEAMLERPALAASDYHLAHSPTDGIPYWDTGAPGLVHLGDSLDRPSDPFNDHEPIDSSAAAITAQGLLRLGQRSRVRSPQEDEPYTAAGLTILKHLLEEPYLGTDPAHQGLLLHTIYHRPRGWDHVPDGSRIPRGEAAQWGDYHLREAALCVQRLAEGEPMPTFFSA